MTAKRRLKDNCIKVGLMVILFLFLSLKSCVAKGETITFYHSKYGYVANQHLLADSAGEKTGKSLYLGYELALSRPMYTLKSDLGELNHLRVGSVGAIVGGVLANKIGKLKGNAGLYYSDATLPYSFDLLTATLSANVYLLRIANPRYHTMEPYFVGSISQQHVKFYGNYLDQNEISNYSTSEERFLGRAASTQFNVGLGAEYQLENDQGSFAHLFAEVVFGTPVASRCTREDFNRTRITNPVSISVGISFGKIKPRSK